VSVIASNSASMPSPVCAECKRWQDYFC
jgi:hypothetical protein